MAEGETKQTSFNDTNCNDADECFCEPCNNGGQRIEVGGYCQICEEYLCENCLRVHKNQRITRDHEILDKEQMPKRQGSNTSQCLGVEICKKHHPEKVKYYCNKHDETGCIDCMTLNHTSCKKDRVQDVAGGFPETTEFKVTTLRLNQFHEQLEIMKDVLKTSLKNLNATYDTIQHKIVSFREEMMEYIAHVEKEMTDQVADMKRKEQIAMNNWITENESMTSEVEEILQRIHSVNANRTFVIAKQAKYRLNELEREFGKMQQSEEQRQQYEFRPSTKVETIIRNKTPIGILSRLPNIHTPAVYRGNISIKSKDDKKDCGINDCMILGPDKIVLVDGYNCNIKLADSSTGTILLSYNTSCEPHKVTAISTDQIAVTLPSEKKLLLLHVASTFTKQREIHLNRRCYGIAFKDEKFAVSSKSRVEILNLQGQVLRTIHLSDILKNPLFISFGHGDDNIIVSDCFTGTVTAVTQDGQIIRTYIHDELKTPCGIAVTSNGVLYVCSQDNGSIHAVSSDLKKSNITIRSDNRVVCPRSIAYCHTYHRLYINNASKFVCGKTANIVHIYDLIA